MHGCHRQRPGTEFPGDLGRLYSAGRYRNFSLAKTVARFQHVSDFAAKLDYRIVAGGGFFPGSCALAQGLD